ncbi:MULTISPECIES: DUF58 domain-containing protein [unclassified Streptomyces]|uniref:DUF58 domain-containing protein n=1 Tax=unclassified Streptomyces TaxID=2593676 RepID=UPI002DDC8AB2|nr:MULTISPECIES: DUF58 domain-containing protein [unclassified Streptomyces]WSC36508.1 DUF58 domain-containing protein [Streptomyces sp. NBC_01763]WSC56412.1 DUF58 domain-containing protein [Streptomyces sp. NBC_01761]WSF87250.1 DUF58 domain-containing protein [Streptomyces sp. NBC_01744]
MAAGGPAAMNDGDDKGGLRAALGGLTTRGRSFLAAGIAAAVCAYVLGQGDLLRVGLLLAALPLVCVAVLFRTRYRVAGTRRLSPSRVPAGTEARVHLRMENVSRLPTGLLMLQDRVPYVLGPRPRFVLDRVEAGGRREVSYRVRSDLRGRYPLGPLQLRLSDPFGMCELTRSFSAYDTLVVIPRTEPLPPVRLAGEASGYGEGRQRALALAGEDDVIPRGYRHGDDLRRVHWRSTARYGELMVRREEQPQRARCTVLLDTRRIAYQGTGPDSAFEWAVSGAASALVHMLERGFAVRLLTDDGSSVPGEGEGGFAGSTHESADSAGLMMDTLAVVDHSDGGGLSRAYDVLRGGNQGLLVAFFGDLDEEQAAVAARMRQRSGGAVAFVLDSDTWVQGESHDAAVAGAEERLRLLREAGWTAVLVKPGADLAELWQRAGQQSAVTQSALTGGVTGGTTGFTGGWS